MHGTLDTSLGWVSNGVTGSQAFAAYDMGLDVWLGNSRSNPPRRNTGMPGLLLHMEGTCWGLACQLLVFMMSCIWWQQQQQQQRGSEAWLLVRDLTAACTAHHLSHKPWNLWLRL